MNDTKKRIALDTLSEACEVHQCSKVFCLFSGGDDSLAALRVAVDHPKFCAAVHCNTGIGVEATRVFVRDICRDMRIPLIEYKAVENVNGKGEPDPQIYEQMVTEYGFPGPTKFGHGKMYVRLKDRGIRRLMREHTDRKECVVLASGCRSDESERRMGTVKRIQKGEPSKDGRVNEPRRIWVNHIHDWTKPDTLLFRAANNIPRNPVSAILGRSGECGCGAYAKPGEIDEYMQHDLTRPLGERLFALDKKIRGLGFPWGYGERPPKGWDQTELGELWVQEMQQYGDVGLMCSKCDTQATMATFAANLEKYRQSQGQIKKA